MTRPMYRVLIKLNPNFNQIIWIDIISLFFSNLSLWLAAKLTQLDTNISIDQFISLINQYCLLHVGR